MFLHFSQCFLIVCKIPRGCQHLVVVPHVCLDACLLKARLSEGLSSVWQSSVVVQVVGSPRPSLSGTGVPWVSCLDPPVCPRVQDDPEAKSQTVVVFG